MRTVSSNVQTAIGNKSRRMTVRATFTAMRTYFTSLTSSNAPSNLVETAEAEDYTGQWAHPSCVTRSGSYTYTVFKDSAILKGVRNDQTSATNITYSSATIPTIFRPGVNGDTIFYVDASNNTLYSGAMTWSSFTVSTRTQIAASIPATSGAVHALSSTMVALIYLDAGGFGVKLYHNSGSWHEESAWSNTLMFPGISEVSRSSDVYYTAAVNLGGSTYDTIIYFTGPSRTVDPETAGGAGWRAGSNIKEAQLKSSIADGAVWAVRYCPTTAQWSEPWTALQSDLSEFRCLSAFYYNSKVLLLGQFMRSGEEIKHNPVPMLLTSTDGKYLCIDQYALISKLGWKFVGYISGDTLYLSDINRYVTAAIGAAHFSTAATSVTTTNIVGFSASSSLGGASARLILKADDEVLISNSTVVRLNRCKVEIGYYTSGGSAEYTDYDTYIVNTVNVVYADGVRQLELDLVQEATWRLGTEMPPYYTEIFGKSGTFDSLSDESNMYGTDVSLKEYTRFTVDFWGSEKWKPNSTYTEIDIMKGGGVSVVYHTGGGSESFKGPDIMASIESMEYPTLTQQQVEVSLYGWCRNKVGQTGHVPVTVNMGVFIERNGVEEYHDCTLKATYNGRWRRTYPSYVAYDYPIVFILGSAADGSDMQVGDKIKCFTILITGTNDAAWRIERATITSGVSVVYDELTSSTMEIVEPKGSTPGGFKLPGYGRYMMLSMKPYGSFGSITMASFTRELGDDPTDSTTAISGCGIVLLAENADNCIIVRYQTSHTAGSNRIHIYKVRNGIETCLASSASGYDYNGFVMTVVHSGKNIKCYLRTPDNIYNTEVVSYNWQISDGLMATVGIDYLHNGIYMEKSSPSFRCGGFNSQCANAIPVLIGENLATSFDTLPSSGSVIVDGYRYKYAAKSGNSYYCGPYQYMYSYPRGSYTNAGHTYAAGDYYDMGYFYWQDNTSTWDDLDGYVISSDSGFATEISASDWEPELKDEWDNGPTNRSSHCDNTDFPFQFLSSSCRMYLGPGLTGVYRYDTSQEEITHAWGSRVYQYASEVYTCNYFSSFSNSNDMTVKEIISIIAKTVGASVTFSGDYSNASIALTANTPYQIY